EGLHAAGVSDRSRRSGQVVRRGTDREGQGPDEDAVLGGGPRQDRPLSASVIDLLDGLRVIEIAGDDIWGATAVAHAARILAGVPESDLDVTASSGALALAGEPDRAPVRTTLPQSPFWSGMYAAMGALFALAARAATRRGQQVDVSGQASMVTVHPPACVHW